MRYSYLPRFRGPSPFVLAVGILLIITFAASARGTRERASSPPPPPGPTLDEIVKDLQKPLPAMHDLDPKIVTMLNEPVNLAGDEHQGRVNRGFAIVWLFALSFAVWVMRDSILGLIAPKFATAGEPQASAAERTEPAPEPTQAPATSAIAPPAKTRATRFVRVYPVAIAPAREAAAVPPPVVAQPPVSKKGPGRSEVRRHALSTFVHVHLPVANTQIPPRDGLSKEQIEHFRTIPRFESWVEFLTAARCGNRLAKEALSTSPKHAAVTFPLTSAEIKTYLPYARHTMFSQPWIDHLLSLLRATESFDESITVTSPLGQKHTIPLNASSSVLNQVLGYEGVPEDVRAQLELRRWILVHTRVDGTEHPELLTRFRMAATA